MIVAILAVGAGLVVWKNKVGGHASAGSFNSISKAEIEMLLADVAKSNPAILKRLNEDPEMKKNQLENLKQLLAFASQAKKEGLADDATSKQELENIRSEILAVNYDREINKDKGPMPAFGFISEDQVKAYWDDAAPVDGRTHEQEFNDFLNAKIEVLKKGNPEMNREITEEEKTQARDVFAKMRIYKAEYEKKAESGELSKEFVEKANLQVKLQQAQFLARLYSEKIADKMKVTDEEIAKYITDHPEIDPVQKRAKAQGILDHAKAGEDFATLANENTEDPGNKGADGAGQGGLYKDVPKGRMVGPFEAAALTLEAGQISDLVETDFGFHILKLERKLGKAGDAKEETYDVRHILISTAVKDTTNPMGRDTPVKEYAKTKLEEEKEKKLLDEIVASNNISVPADFDVPQPTAEQLQQMQQQRQQQMQMPPGADGPEGGPAGGPPKPGKPEPKKPEAKPEPKKK